MKLDSFSAAWGRTKIAVVLPHDRQHGVAEHQTQSPIARPAALAGNQTVRTPARKACSSR
jgi:hypothetical protein